MITLENIEIVCKFFKPGTRLRAPGFLQLIMCGSSVCVFAYVCVCVSAPEAINNYWRDVAWYRPHTIG